VKRRQFAVIGLGRFGSAVATTLAKAGHDVIGVDAEAEKVRQLADVLTLAVELDATDAKALRAAGIQNVEVAVVSIGENIESSVLVVMQLADLNVKTILAKAVTPLHGRILEKLGVSRVIYPEYEMAVRVAHGLMMPTVLDYVELSKDFSIIETPAPAAFVGRTLQDIQLRPQFGLMLIAIKRRPKPDAEQATTIAPAATETILEGDVLALLGPNERLVEFDTKMKRDA
jgi:trk system potassium uptake protein TrkA